MISYQSFYSDLLDNALYRDSVAKLPPGSVFRMRPHKGKPYWYYQFRDKDKVVTKYLGRETDTLLDFMKRERETSETNRLCRESTKTLLRSGFPGPGMMLGNVLESLSNAGFFRLRGVLVGTLAFHCYSSIYGERLATSMQTMDVDIAQFPQISIAVQDTLEENFVDVLNKTGRFLPDLNFERKPTPKWRDSQSSCVIDVLSPLVGKEEEPYSRLQSMKTSAIKLKFLDFLLYDEIPAVSLYKNGVTVNIPRAERYAIHKLIIANDRHGPEKKYKDIQQAQILVRTLDKFYQRNNLLEVFHEAMSRGPGWARRLNESLSIVDNDVRDILTKDPLRM